MARELTTAEKLEILRGTAIKVLRETPERYKRERVYESLEGRAPHLVGELRALLGDTDGNRDTRDAS